MSSDRLLHPHWQGQLADYITAIAWSPTASQFAATSAAGEVAVWNGTNLVHLLPAHDQSMDCLGYSADGQFLAAGGQQGKLYIWAAQELIATLDYPRVWIDQLAWHPTEPILAFSSGKQVQLWDAVQRQIVNSLDFDRSTIFNLAWQPQGEYLAVAGYQGAAIWQWQQNVTELFGVDTGFYTIAWSEDGQYLAAATFDRQLSIARIKELEMPWVMQGFPGKIQQLAWMNGSLAVVSAAELVWWHYTDDTWQATSTQIVTVMQMAMLSLLSVVTTMDSSGLLTLSDSHMVTLSSINWSCGHCTTMIWATSGQYLACGSNRGDLTVFNIEIY